MTKYDISKWMLPREYTTCPGCGLQYGHHNTKVCIACEECSKCCPCEDKSEHKEVKEAVSILL
jgi:hypothetical protein